MAFWTDEAIVEMEKNNPFWDLDNKEVPYWRKISARTNVDLQKRVVEIRRKQTPEQRELEEKINMIVGIIVALIILFFVIKNLLEGVVGDFLSDAGMFIIGHIFPPIVVGAGVAGLYYGGKVLLKKGVDTIQILIIKSQPKQMANVNRITLNGKFKREINKIKIISDWINKKRQKEYSKSPNFPFHEKNEKIRPRKLRREQRHHIRYAIKFLNNEIQILFKLNHLNAIYSNARNIMLRLIANDLERLVELNKIPEKKVNGFFNLISKQYNKNLRNLRIINKNILDEHKAQFQKLPKEENLLTNFSNEKIKILLYKKDFKNYSEYVHKTNPKIYQKFIKQLPFFELDQLDDITRNEYEIKTKPVNRLLLKHNKPSEQDTIFTALKTSPELVHELK